MVVMGGIFLLDSDDDEEDRRRQDVARRAKTTLPVVAYLTPRPWMLMYNQLLPIPESSRDKKGKLGLIQKLLPEDVMLEIFTRMTPVAVSRAACCCRSWRLLSNHENIWEKVSYHAWECREEPKDTERIARDRFHGSWRRMFFNRVRLRTEGRAGWFTGEEGSGVLGFCCILCSSCSNRLFRRRLLVPPRFLNCTLTTPLLIHLRL